MTSIRNLLVLVPLLTSFVKAQNLNYPYPYAQQQYPNIGGEVNNFGAPASSQFVPNYPNPYQGFYPMYPQQYPVYPSYPPVSYPGSLPAGYPDQQYPGLSQYPPGTNVFPSNYPVPNPQAIQTPFGNIPVEIIDVDENGTPIDTIRQVESNGTETENTKFTPITRESKNVFDVSSSPTTNTKYTKMEPSQTKIVRTIEPKGEIRVDIQTPSPPASRDKNSDKKDNNEENDTTTTKWTLFG